MKTQTFTVILSKEDDMYIAECLDIGIVDQGKIIEEAINNLKEATKLYLEKSDPVKI
jgi:predicted RNase H-like HicB family nuclease